MCERNSYSKWGVKCDNHTQEVEDILVYEETIHENETWWRSLVFWFRKIFIFLFIFFQYENFWMKMTDSCSLFLRILACDSGCMVVFIILINLGKSWFWDTCPDTPGKSWIFIKNFRKLRFSNRVKFICIFSLESGINILHLKLDKKHKQERCF